MIRRWLSQTLAVSALSVRTIPQRASSSAVAMIGIAGVVIVFVAVLSIGEGFRAAMADASAPDRAIVMRTGADSEMTSSLPGGEVQLIEQAPGLLRVSNRPIASAELYVLVDLNKRTTGTPANVPLRGIAADALEVRNETHIIDGRMFQFGTNEAIVGRAANRQFSGVDLGSEFMSGNLRTASRRDFRVERLGRRNGNLVRQPSDTRRVRARQLVPVGAGKARLTGGV